MCTHMYNLQGLFNTYLGILSTFDRFQRVPVKLIREANQGRRFSALGGRKDTSNLDFSNHGKKIYPCGNSMPASVLTELFTASLTELLLASFFWDLLQKQNKSAEMLNTPFWSCENILVYTAALTTSVQCKGQIPSADVSASPHFLMSCTPTLPPPQELTTSSPSFRQGINHCTLPYPSLSCSLQLAAFTAQLAESV